MEDELKASEQEQTLNLSSSSPIEHFFRQMTSASHLVQRARAINQQLDNQSHSIQVQASSMMQYFDNQKEEILKKFDSWLLPVAQEVLDELSCHTERLKLDLDQKLESFHQVHDHEWVEHAKSWVHLYAKWHDRKALIQQVLHLAAERANHLIDKDVQMIEDYQKQSLAQWTEETEEFHSLESRLTTAIENPLKSLLALKVHPDNLSAMQASEWAAHVHQERQTYFNQLLSKIDNVVRESGQFEETPPSLDFSEQESDLVFMETELRHLNNVIRYIDRRDSKGIQFIWDHLKHLEDHLKELNALNLPDTLRRQSQGLFEGIEIAKKWLEDKI